MKRDEVIVVSCYVTDIDITEPRHVYNKSNKDWPEGAKLMFECASNLPLNTPFDAYMREHGWDIDDGGRLFTQINQSEILSEFLNVLVSPLDQRNMASKGEYMVRDGGEAQYRPEVVDRRAGQEVTTGARNPVRDDTNITRMASAPAQYLEEKTQVVVASHHRPSDDSGKLLFLITNWTFASGIILFLIGVVLVLIGGANADSSIELFGQNVKTTSVGLATACVGVIMIVSNIRRILKSFDKHGDRGRG